VPISRVAGETGEKGEKRMGKNGIQNSFSSIVAARKSKIARYAANEERKATEREREEGNKDKICLNREKERERERERATKRGSKRSRVSERDAERARGACALREKRGACRRVPESRAYRALA